MTQKIKYGNTFALTEYMIEGNRVSRLESLLLFGVQNFTAVLPLIKRKGFIVKPNSAYGYQKKRLYGILIIDVGIKRETVTKHHI